MTRILVTGANGDIAEAVGRILREEFPEGHIAGADAFGKWPGGFFFNDMLDLPPADSASFLDALHRVSSGFDVVIPTSEPELRSLARTDGLHSSLPLLRVSNNLVNTFLDKREASHFFTRNRLPTPRTTSLHEWRSHSLPFCVKPVRGAGGRGFQVVRHQRQAQELDARDPSSWLVQEYVPGEDNEYTCAVFNWRGDRRFVVMKRLLQGGRTVRAEICDVRAITHVLEEVVRATNLEGCINVQLMLAPEGPTILEVNPRLSSTVMMRHLAGFNDCAWWVRSFLGMTIDQAAPPSVGTIIYRTSAEKVLPAKSRDDARQ